MSYRYLGYGITDSNGEAKLEYDENGNHLDHSITGTGAGELDIVASLDKPIGSGSIVSETYEIFDCTFKDINGENTSWTNNSNNIDVTTSDTGVTLKAKVDSGQSRYIVPTASIPSAPYAIEFDKDFTSSSNDQIVVVGGKAIYFSRYSALQTGTHVKFQLNSDNTIEWWIDGVKQTNETYSSATTVRFQITNTNSIIKYSNFKIYPV